MKTLANRWRAVWARAYDWCRLWDQDLRCDGTGEQIESYFRGVLQLLHGMEQVHIGHYILGRTIGTGGFAKVKEAKHDLTGVKVAIKIINKRKMKNKNLISKVKRQIKILKFISHQNIIKLYQVLDTTNDIFVIMQLAQGGELYDYIQSNDISEQEARFFFRQIISGVGYAHLNLIAHRDLKPENILINNNKLIKIVDFGLSNLMKDGRLLKTACGSPNYAAPEIVGERKYEGTSVDIWSCGVILYALLVGSLPFDEETVTLLYRKIQQGNYSIPNTVNPLAADLIRRMLQVDPYKRIRIHQILVHPWIRSKVPLYARVPRSYALQKEDTFEIDQEVFNQVRKMGFANLQGELNDERIKKSIKKRDDQSFVITYELLKDQKERKENAQELVSSQYTCNNLIVTEIENTLSPRPADARSDYLYGRRINKPVKILTQIIIQAFRLLGIDFSIKNKEYCMRCVYLSTPTRPTINPRTVRRPAEMLDEKDEPKEDKFTKREIRFTLQVYSSDQKGYQHMLDLQLNQGHPMVFFSIAQRFYKMVEHNCQSH